MRPGGLIALLWKHAAPDEPYDELAMRVLEGLTGRYFRIGLREPDVSALGETRALRFEWELEWTVDTYVGFQESRERVRQRAGEHRERFLDEFRRRLDAPVGGRTFRERQIDKLYLARAPRP